MELFVIAILLTVAGVEGKNEEATTVPIFWAKLGTSVTVPCPLRLRSCTGIKWKKINESGVSISMDQPPGKFLTNDCGLVINYVNQADAVYYQCTISGQSQGVYLFAYQSEPNCYTNPPATSKTTAENDTIQYVCNGTVYGFGQPRVMWYDKDGKKVTGQPPDQTTGYNIYRTFSTSAKAPKVKTMQCYASFQSKLVDLSVKICETKEFKILYSVRNVETWPLLYVGPGEELTCSADANPNATFSWLVKEEGASEWTTFSEGKTVVAELKNETSSAQYKCVAVNYVKGKRHEAESLEVTVTKYGKLIRIVIIVSICVVVLLAAIVGVIVYKKVTGNWPNPQALFKSD